MPVTYGAAYDSAGARIESESTQGSLPPYACIGCGWPMIAKTVDRPNRRVAKHFAHKAENPACAYESILHADAKRLIAESIAAAPKYWLGVTCSECHRVIHRRNVAGAKAEMEQPIGGNRADVLAHTLEGKSVAIEVVVSHDLEQDSRLRYAASAIPVLRARVASIDDLPVLRREVFVEETDYLGPALPPCAGCEEERRIEQEREARRQREWYEWEAYQKSLNAMLGKVKRPTITCSHCGVLFARPVSALCPKDSWLEQWASRCLFGDEAQTRWVQDMRMLGLPLKRPPWKEYDG